MTVAEMRILSKDLSQRYAKPTLVWERPSGGSTITRSARLFLLLGFVSFGEAREFRQQEQKSALVVPGSRRSQTPKTLALYLTPIDLNVTLTNQELQPNRRIGKLSCENKCV